jgi:Transposase DDE domain
LVKLGHVALDGTKIQANASAHKAMSYGRMREAEKKLASEVASWVARAEATDAEEDRVHGADKRGDEMPEWVADKAARLERIRAAKAALEQEAREPLPDADDDGPGPSSGMMKNGRPQRAADGGPPNRAQRNFTDPESRIQPVRGGVIAGYNAQIAVDAAHQIIVAQRVQTSPADRRGLKSLLAGIRKVLRANPKGVSADAGFCNEANLAHLARRRINGYLAPGRARQANRMQQDRGAGQRARAWPRWRSSSNVPDEEADTASGSNSRNQSSARSRASEGFVSSFCVGSKRSEASGRWSEPPTTCSSSQR